MIKNDIGIIGISTMGANLAMNLADHETAVALFNRSPEKADEAARSYRGNGNMTAYTTLPEFVESLKLPRKIILMVKAGDAVDEVLSQLKPLLGKGDSIIDGGNSFFKDTIRREQAFSPSGVFFVGMGISGGEEGARRGPSLMPGGSAESYSQASPILEKIAAKDFSGRPCLSHIGENGAGHYVKMVHNGIEYVDMELIAESYSIMKSGLGMDNDSIATIFENWNTGRLNSYLVEITGRILKTKDRDGSYIVDAMLDAAGSKGTGKWTSEETLEVGIPGFSLSAAVFSRYASEEKSRREAASALFQRSDQTVDLSTDTLERALFAGKMLAYIEGFSLLEKAERAHNWNFDFSEISRIWQGGCIIRAALLREIASACATGEKALLLNPRIANMLAQDIPALRKTAAQAVQAGIPIPGFSAALSFFDSMTTKRLPANLIQAQRDLFGAHGFARDMNGPMEHFNWEKPA